MWCIYINFLQNQDCNSYIGLLLPHFIPYTFPQVFTYSSKPRFGVTPSISGSVSLGHLLAVPCEEAKGEQKTGWRERSFVFLPGFCHLIAPSPASLCPSVKWGWWFSFYQPHSVVVWRLMLNRRDESAQGCRTGLLWLLCGWGCLLLLFINTSIRNPAGGGFLSFLRAALAWAAQLTGSTSAPNVSLCCLSWWKMTSYYFLPLCLGGTKEISSHIKLLLLL